MPCDIAGGTSALGVHGAFEVSPLFERKLPSDDVGFDRGGWTDVHAVGGDMAFQISVDGNRSRGDLCANAGSRTGHEIVPLQFNRAFEQAIDDDILARRELAPNCQCRAATHGLYFRPLLIISAS